MKEQEKDQATLLMKGEIDPPNEAAAFIVKRVRELSEAGEQLMTMHDALKKKLAGVQRQILETNGALDQYRKDLNLLAIPSRQLAPVPTPEEPGEPREPLESQSEPKPNPLQKVVDGVVV